MTLRHDARVSDEPTPAQIDVRPNGPLHVQGPARIIGTDGEVLKGLATGDSAWLCRCGQSQRKPFCDGSHTRVGFTDPTPGQ